MYFDWPIGVIRVASNPPLYLGDRHRISLPDGNGFPGSYLVDDFEGSGKAMRSALPRTYIYFTMDFGTENMY